MSYINTALNYTGSKFKLLDQIIPEMDYTKKYFVDLFAGSAVVGFNVVDKYDKILENDILKDLIEIHKNLCKKPYSFIKNVKKLAVSKDDQEGFNNLRKYYNETKSADAFYALILCSTNNMIRFNQKGEYNQTFGKRTFSDSTEKKLNEFVEYITPYKNKIYFSSAHFDNVKIVNNSYSMFYIDPPYSRTMDNYGNITNDQITDAGYNRYYKKEDDIKLYNYCLKLNENGHSFMVSGLLEHDGKQSWLMNKLIENFRYKVLNFNYNSVSRKGKKDSTEIIVMNY